MNSLYGRLSLDLGLFLSSIHDVGKKKNTWRFESLFIKVSYLHIHTSEEMNCFDDTFSRTALLLKTDSTTIQTNYFEIFSFFSPIFSSWRGRLKKEALSSKIGCQIQTSFLHAPLLQTSAATEHTPMILSIFQTFLKDIFYSFLNIQ